jgi:hypothetical protein
VIAACLAAGHAPNSPEYNQCLEKGLTAGFAADAATQLHQKRLTELLAVKPIFQLDIAGAGSWIYKDNTLSESHSYRMGVWTTMEFSLPLSSTSNVEEMLANQNYLNLYASFRYIQEDSTTDFKTFRRQDLLDIGGRLEVEFNKFNLSFEAIRRFNQRDKDLNTSRNVGIVQYKINDQLFLTGTFGKNFGTVKNLIALFGLNWGLGKQSLTQ